MTETRNGSCLCGGITYTITGDMTDVTTCHCTQCRKQTGHHYATSSFHNDAFALNDKGGLLKWYRASDQAQRGFCGQCGSALFWKRDDHKYVSVMVGTIDGPTGLKLGNQIFTEDKGDYYQLDKDVPSHLQGG